MSNRLTGFIIAVGRAVMSLGYWLLVSMYFYGAIAGDRRSDAPPLTAWQTYAVPVGIVVAAILAHALLDVAWSSRQRLDAR